MVVVSSSSYYFRPPCSSICTPQSPRCVSLGLITGTFFLYAKRDLCSYLVEVITSRQLLEEEAPSLLGAGGTPRVECRELLEGSSRTLTALVHASSPARGATKICSLPRPDGKLLLLSPLAESPRSECERSLLLSFPTSSTSPEAVSFLPDSRPG